MFIELTLNNGEGKILINLDTLANIRPFQSGCRLWEKGVLDEFYEVVESYAAVRACLAAWGEIGVVEVRE